MKDNGLTVREEDGNALKHPDAVRSHQKGILKSIVRAFGSKDSYVRDVINDRNRIDMLFHGFGEMSQMYWRTPGNMIIAGGSQAARFSYEKYFIENALRHEVPVVLIHTGNPHISGRYKVTARLPGERYGEYAPLAGLAPHLAANILTDLGMRLSKLPNLIGLWSLVTELISFGNQRITVDSLIAFPYYDFESYLNNPNNNVPPERMAEFINRSGAVAAQANEAQAIVHQLRSIPLPDVGNRKRYSLSSIISNKGMACINLISHANIFYQELCFAEIEQMQREGRGFLLVMDCLRMTGEAGSIFDRVLVDKHSNTPVVVVTDDLYASVNGKSEIFKNVTGGENTDVLVLKHPSESSAKLWSEYFGEYYHVAINESLTKTKSGFNPLSSSSSAGITTSENLRSRVMPYQITSLDEGHAVARTANDDQLHYVVMGG